MMQFFLQDTPRQIGLQMAYREMDNGTVPAFPMRDNSRAYSGEDFDNMSGTNGVIRVLMLQHSSNQHQMLDSSSGGLSAMLTMLTRREKPAYARIILMNPLKDSTLRQTMRTE
jgi:hypothetical protein